MVHALIYGNFSDESSGTYKIVSNICEERNLKKPGFPHVLLRYFTCNKYSYILNKVCKCVYLLCFNTKLYMN